MTEKETPDIIETKKLTTNQEILATAVVALVVGFLVRNALKEKKDINTDDLPDMIRKEVEPLIHELPDPVVDHFVRAKDTFGLKRRFLERILDIFRKPKR